MNYDQIDTASRARSLALATGFGDLSVLTENDALSAERSAVVIELRVVFIEAHIRGGDLDSEALMALRNAVLPGMVTARATADRISSALNVDVSRVRPEIYAVNLQKAEGDHFDADWRLSNLPEETPEETARLTLIRDRAEREIAILKAG